MKVNETPVVDIRQQLLEQQKIMLGGVSKANNNQGFGGMQNPMLPNLIPSPNIGAL